MINMLPWQQALHIRQAVSSSLPKGGEYYADYFDLPFVWIYIYDQSKTLKPPPGGVTVSL